MRIIGTFSDGETARHFSAVLDARSIGHRLDPTPGGGAEVWVYEEEQVAEARVLHGRFMASPGDPEWQAKAPPLKKPKDDDVRFRHVDARTQLFRRRSSGVTVTWMLIAFSVLAFLASLGQGSRDALYAWFLFSYPGDFGFAALLQGQVWRLVTPIFVHLGILHLLFNMIWLRDLGSLMETESGPRFLVFFVLVTAVISNTAQYVVTGAAFGGMSGVLYALLGYAWMRSRYEPGSGYGLSDTAAIMMLVWFFLCVFGIIPRVANLAHGAGLVAGMVWGLAQATRRRGSFPVNLSRRDEWWVLAVLLMSLPLAYFADRF